MLKGNKPFPFGYAQSTKRRIIGHVPVAASQAFTDDGGKFVKLDTNDRADIADSGDTVVFGWACVGDFTASATAGRDLIPVDTSRETQYWIPADAAVTRAMVGNTCDLIVTAADVQQADVGENNEAILWIDDVDITNQMVLVHIYDKTNVGVV